MAKNKTRTVRPKARLPRGLRDIGASELRAVDAMLRTIARVYESYGFEPLATPAFEYSDALGKFLPDQDRPNEGVFSFQDDDEQWISLRYDLTAPLARYVAENYDRLPKPFRRYQTGSVWRNEKPGPGRYREFVQFDADTVGAASVAADAEMCMMAADTLEALGIGRGDYVIKVSNRKVLDGVLETIDIDPKEDAHLGRRLTVLRAVDKIDRLGWDAVALLLGPGRTDESGDHTPGAGLSERQIAQLKSYLSTPHAADVRAGAPSHGELWPEDASTFAAWREVVKASDVGRQGVDELEAMCRLCRAADFGPTRIVFDASVVRGLEYYTGPVFEAELTFEISDDRGRPVRFGSVGGGGRYDGLIERFTGQRVPATGFSVGVSRLYAALTALGRIGTAAAPGPVVVTVFDKARLADYQRMVQALRAANIRAELYFGQGKMGQQLKYADQRGSPCVVIQGPDEAARGEVQIKDLIEGARLAREIADNVEWRESRPAQFAVPAERLVEAVREVLARHGA